MPSKKKKYNARFPPARIKKIMQTDEEVGKVAAPVPVIISRALELFVESLLKKSVQVTMARSAKTLSPAHLKQCVMAESRFDFLRELLASVPDIQGDGEESPLVGILPPTPLSLTPVSPHVYGIPPRTHPLSAPVGEAPAQRGRGRPRGRPRRTQAITPSLGRGAAPKRGLSTTTESEDDDDDSDEDDDDDEEGNSKDSAQVHQPHVPPSWNTFTPGGPSFQPLPVGMPGANQAVALNFYQETSASMAPATAPTQPSVSGVSFYTDANGLNLSMNKASASGQSVQGTEDDYDNY